MTSPGKAAGGRCSGRSPRLGRQVRQHARGNLVPVRPDVGGQLQGAERRRAAEVGAAQRRRSLQKQLIDGRPAGTVILLAHHADGGNAGHQRNHAPLGGVLAAVGAGPASDGDQVQAVDHDHVLLKRGERRALERKREVGRRRAGIRDPVRRARDSFPADAE